MSFHVSLFILIYRNQEKVARALRSVFSQKIPADFRVELVVSDDGSPNFDADALNKMLNDLAKQNLQIEWRFEGQPENLGTVKHANKVIESLRGEVIIPLAADDELYDANSLCKIVDFFDDPCVNIATGLRAVYSESFCEFVGFFPEQRLRNVFLDSGRLLDYILRNGNIISGACTYYRRSVFNELGFFDVRYRLLEDFPFYLNALQNGVDIKLIEHPLIKYQMGGISTSGSISEALRLDFVRVYESLLLDGRVPKKYHRIFKFRLFKLKALSLSVIDFLRMLDIFVVHYYRAIVRRVLKS